MKSSKNSTNNLQKHQVNTIDEKHKEMLDRFQDIETNTIPTIQKEIENLKNKIKTLSENQIELYLDLKDKINSLKAEIKELKQEKKNYLLENSKYIFQYFEQKQQISTGSTANQNTNVLNSFFKIKSITSESESIQNDKYAHSKKAYQNYWRNVNNEISNIQDFVVPSDVCEICHCGELIPQDEEGILICNNIF